MTLLHRKEGVPRPRHVHLGDRLLAIGRLRAGLATVDEVAEQHEVSREDVLDWVARHAHERTLTLDELRAQGSPEMSRLARRAQRLAQLVAQAERNLRALHQELVRGLDANNEPFEASNIFDEISHDGRRRVAGPQPERESTRKFVDGASRR